MSASSLSLSIFLRINFLISYLDSNRLTEHNRLTHTESFAEWQKAGAGCTSRAFKHHGHDVTAPEVWPSILTDYTYDSELDSADGVPLAFRRSSMFLEGNSQFTRCNYEFYEDVNAFYKLVSRNYDNYDMAWTHLYSWFQCWIFCIITPGTWFFRNHSNSIIHTNSNSYSDLLLKNIYCYYVENSWVEFFRFLWWIESLEGQHLSEIEIFCNIINVFNSFLYSKSSHYNDL